MYKGRKDFQIKHMGYRIELGEIEAAALALNGVDKACAIYDYNKKNVVLAYEAEANIKRKDILLGLRERLPKYMLPARFENIKVMPTNVNGKIDRAKLKDDILNVRN
jgi:acyl-coenzyme A synthetase/AMP-(fatty) acid ligase